MNTKQKIGVACFATMLFSSLVFVWVGVWIDYPKDMPNAIQLTEFALYLVGSAFLIWGVGE